MVRRLADHGKKCTAVRSALVGQGRIVPCPCSKSLAFLCPCGEVVTLRGGSCADYRDFTAARRNLVVY
jgi:hypothetical protein